MTRHVSRCVFTGRRDRSAARVASQSMRGVLSTVRRIAAVEPCNILRLLGHETPRVNGRAIALPRQILCVGGKIARRLPDEPKRTRCTDRKSLPGIPESGPSTGLQRMAAELAPPLEAQAERRPLVVALLWTLHLPEGLAPANTEPAMIRMSRKVISETDEYCKTAEDRPKIAPRAVVEFLVNLGRSRS